MKIQIVLSVIESSLEVKLPTIWTDGKAQPGRNQTWRKSEGRRSGREKIREGESQREDAGARKGRKVAKHCVFPMFCGSGEWESRLAKAAGADPAR